MMRKVRNLLQCQNDSFIFLFYIYILINLMPNLVKIAHIFTGLKAGVFHLVCSNIFLLSKRDILHAEACTVLYVVPR